MDAQYPSKRFTRGIPLHVQIDVENPSFSLGLTQKFGEISGSLSKSTNMQDIRSNSNNDPISFVNGSLKNTVDVVTGSKKKRKHKSDVHTSHNDKNEGVGSESIEHKDVKYLGQREPTRIPHMQCYTNIDVMNVQSSKLTESQYRQFCGNTCFAQLCSIRRCHVQAQLIRCMFFREIEGSSKNAILIHVNGTTLRFTIRDFALITGLKCSDNENDFVSNTNEPNRIIHQYFEVGKPVTKSQLIDKFDKKIWVDNDDDAVKFAILFYIHSFIFSEEPIGTVIDRKDFDLVESGRYIDYPWGKKAFDIMIMHLHSKIKHDGKYFRLYGFPLALQVWFYECCSKFDDEIAVKVSDHIPRILNLETKKDFPRLSYFAKGIFRDDNNPDPPSPINNRGKEKIDTYSSPPKKKSRRTISHIQNKSPPRVISKQRGLTKPPRNVSIAKITKAPYPKKQTKKSAKVPAIACIKKNVELKESIASKIPSTSKSQDFNISRDEFDRFKISMEKQFTDLRNFIEINFKVVLDSIKTKNAEDKGDDVEVTRKVSTVGVDQSEEPSLNLPSKLNYQSVLNDLNDQENFVRVNVTSSSPEVTFQQSSSRSPAVQSDFSPLLQQFNTPEPQTEKCEDVPVEVDKERSQFMDDQAEFNNPLFELLNVIYDQTEKMEQEELGDTNKAGSSNADELVVEEDFIFSKPLQIVNDDQTKINIERSIVLHPLLAMDKHTPLPIPRERRPGPFNTSPYVTTFSSESGSSSRFNYVFELKHPFVAMSDVDLTTLYLHFWKWLNEWLLVRHSAK
ncbi:uncharacterized protein [Solanum lycopersicum]|uniref:uncharacterized protein n=1 Tax=Solanum lycopersicum TaxID=4081 RepID=UPI0037480C22